MSFHRRRVEQEALTPATARRKLAMAPEAQCPKSRKA
jgi:hypothetical protein